MSSSDPNKRLQLAGHMTLTRQLLDALGREIVVGTYNSKHFPTEAEISEMYDTSRSITREATKMLAAKGMLSARRRSGIVVQPERNWSMLDADVLRWIMERKLTPGLLRAFSEMRLGIEPAAAMLAARNANPTAITEIERGLQRMIAAERGEDDSLASDVAFHVAILDATENPFYVQLHELVHTALSFSIRFTNRIGGHTASIPAHRTVFNAIKSGDATGAHAAMSGIIEDALKLIEVGAKKTTAKSVAKKGKPAKKSSRRAA
jgi:DNA-binding FadR family transcriptional regulator